MNSLLLLPLPLLLLLLCFFFLSFQWCLLRGVLAALRLRWRRRRRGEGEEFGQAGGDVAGEDQPGHLSSAARFHGYRTLLRRRPFTAFTAFFAVAFCQTLPFPITAAAAAAAAAAALAAAVEEAQRHGEQVKRSLGPVEGLRSAL